MNMIIRDWIIKFFGKLKRYSNPEEACCAPNPSEVAKPKSVAKIATISIKSPCHLQVLLPNRGKKIDLIISDMAVNTIGNKDVDSIVTGELCLEGMDFALEVLKEHGKFVSKIFMGSSFNEIVYKAKKKFRDVRVFKPLASRKNSKETFIICSFLR